MDVTRTIPISPNDLNRYSPYSNSMLLPYDGTYVRTFMFTEIFTLQKGTHALTYDSKTVGTGSNSRHKICKGVIIKKKANCYSSGNSISSSVSANLIYKVLVSSQNFKASLRFSSQVDSMSLSYRVCDLFFRIYKFTIRRKRNLASHLV